MTDAQSSSRVYIDTNIFVGAYESDGDIARDLRGLFERLRVKQKTAVTSELTLAELGVREGSSRRFYLGLIVSSAFIDLQPVSREILLETATFRAFLKRSGRSMKSPDAIRCVTAVKPDASTC